MQNKAGAEAVEGKKFENGPNTHLNRTFRPLASPNPLFLITASVYCIAQHVSYTNYACGVENNHNWWRYKAKSSFAKFGQKTHPPTSGPI